MDRIIGLFSGNSHGAQVSLHEQYFITANHCLEKGDITGALIEAGKAEKQGYVDAVIQLGLKCNTKEQARNYFERILSEPSYQHKYREAALALIEILYRYFSSDDKQIALLAQKVTAPLTANESEMQENLNLLALGEMYLVNSFWSDKTDYAKPLLERITIEIDGKKFPKMKELLDVEQKKALQEAMISGSIN
jgi:hypothetical protein